MHCLHPLTASIHCFPFLKFSLQHVLLFPDSSPAHVCSVPTAWMMSSFSSPVIVLLITLFCVLIVFEVLLMIRHRHSSAPTGLMPLSFFFTETSLHVRRVDM